MCIVCCPYVNLCVLCVNGETMSLCGDVHAPRPLCSGRSSSMQTIITNYYYCSIRLADSTHCTCIFFAQHFSPSFGYISFLFISFRMHLLSMSNCWILRMDFSVFRFCFSCFIVLGCKFELIFVFLSSLRLCDWSRCSRAFRHHKMNESVKFNDWMTNDRSGGDQEFAEVSQNSFTSVDGRSRVAAVSPSRWMMGTQVSVTNRKEMSLGWIN